MGKKNKGKAAEAPGSAVLDTINRTHAFDAEQKIILREILTAGTSGAGADTSTTEPDGGADEATEDTDNGI